jgi:ribonuclease D
MYELLETSKKLNWALEEFAAILNAPPAPPRVDPWRRTSGMHKIKRREQLAVIKELWHARDKVASEQDISPGKLLNDSAIVELAIAPAVTKKEFEKALRPLGLRARWLENLPLWLSSISVAVSLPEDQWPAMRTNADTLPPIKLWRDKFPEKFAPLSHARAAIEIIAQDNHIPVENLISPEYVRRVCWKPPTGATETLSIPTVEQALTELGARQWQIALVAPALAAALLEKEAVPVPEAPAGDVTENTPEEA